MSQEVANPTPEDFLSLPDNEANEMDLGFLQSESKAEDDATSEGMPTDQGDSPESEATEDDDTDEDETETEEEEETSDDDTEEETDSDDDSASDETSEESDESETESEQTEGDDTPEEAKDVDATSDHKNIVDKLFAPFQANGKSMQVDNVDDAIKLMQMGAGFHKNMAKMKPSLRKARTLEKHGLFSDEQIDFMVDLSKGNPDAISKLLREAKIDPLSLKVEEESDYSPTKHSMDESEFEFTEVLGDLKESPNYDRLIKTVSSEWDDRSRTTIAQAPQVLETINDHMTNGVYDVIQAEMEKERALGRLNGLSDLEAYKTVGDAINARNGFAHLFQGQEQRQDPASAKSNAPAKADPKLKERRKAASPTSKAKPTPAKAAQKNPLTMSDEEFEALGVL